MTKHTVQIPYAVRHGAASCGPRVNLSGFIFALGLPSANSKHCFSRWAGGPLFHEKGGETMPVIDLENVVGVLESDGKVRCSDCIDQMEEYWEKTFDPGKDQQKIDDDLADAKLYICDYCNEKL
jgi:hypothetical protein